MAGTTSEPVVLIIGGGFGGLEAAHVLKKSAAKVLLIDRNNHHVFQPLLYQVATSVLSPGQIGSPLRRVLASSKNTTVLEGTVTGIDTAGRNVSVDYTDRKDVKVSYDFLILAMGVEDSYFGKNEFAQYAPALKGLADAVAIRNKILQAFESAEAEDDPKRIAELLTFVMVGAGPTGVEMASAIAEMIRHPLKGEFRRINPQSARIVLADKGKRPLAAFSSSLSDATKRRLEGLGVELRLGQSVDSIDAEGVIVDGERIRSATVIWTAGVAAPSITKDLNTATDHAGRVRINSDLTVPGHPEVFVIGDMASLDRDGKPLPGVAQVAIQQGRYAAKLIRKRMGGKTLPAPFSYFDKGNLAVVGRNFAVLEVGKFKLSGFLAWLVWAGVHLQYLGQSSLRLSVFVQWMWTYTTGQGGSRLIVKHRKFQGE